MKIRTKKALLLAGGIMALLAGCGGGGGGDSSPPATVNYGPANGSACPRSVQSDIWLNQRLGCLGAGQLVLNAALGATGAVADRAFIINQSALDLSLHNVLGVDVARFFKYFVCVQRAPANIQGRAVAADLAVSVGLAQTVSGRTYYPASISGSTLDFGGSADVHMLQETCDQSKHAVVIDYATGRVNSLNPAALPALTVYED